MPSTEQKQLYTPNEVLSHCPPMVLLDEILGWGEDWIEALVTHDKPSVFTNSDGKIPSWVSLEYICQVVAAFAGIRRLNQQEPVTIGFVMGTRKMDLAIPYFLPKQAIKLRVEEQMKSQNQIGVYGCTIHTLDGTLITSTILKAVMPEDPDSVINLRG